jgi:hypothetical protein
MHNDKEMKIYISIHYDIFLDCLNASRGGDLSFHILHMVSIDFDNSYNFEGTIPFGANLPLLSLLPVTFSFLSTWSPNLNLLFLTQTL